MLFYSNLFHLRPSGVMKPLVAVDSNVVNSHCTLGVPGNAPLAKTRVTNKFRNCIHCSQPWAQSSAIALIEPTGTANSKTKRQFRSREKYEAA
eukprot:IDg16594t1